MAGTVKHTPASRRRLTAGASVLVGVVIGCGDPAGPPGVVSVEIIPTAQTLTALSDTIRFTAVARDATGDSVPGAHFVWTSWNQSIAAVQAETGLVTAVANGTATISATTDGVWGTAELTVRQVVATVYVASPRDTLRFFGDSMQLVATARDGLGNAVNPATFTWSSSNELAATVSSVGVATAMASDTATISASTSGQTGSVVVTISFLRWSFPTGARVVTAPAIGADGTVYFGLQRYSDNVYALNPDGTVKWSFSTGGWVESVAIDVAGTLYVVSGDLYALSPDGTVQWSHSAVTGGYNSDIAIGADGTVYVASFSNVLYKLDALNPDGTLRWSYFMGHYILGAPAIGSDGTVYVGCQRSLYALNPDGTLRWSYLTGGSMTYSRPAIGADGTVYFGSWDDNLYALNPDGTLRWSYPTGTHPSPPIVGVGGTVFVGSAGTLAALNPDGTLLWSRLLAAGTQTVGKLRSPTIGADGTVFVASRDTLYALAPDGDRKWSYALVDSSDLSWSSPRGHLSPPAISEDGTLYGGLGARGADYGYLWAINTRQAGLAQSPWPKFQHDNRNTGNVITR